MSVRHSSMSQAHARLSAIEVRSVWRTIKTCQGVTGSSRHMGGGGGWLAGCVAVVLRSACTAAAVTLRQSRMIDVQESPHALLHEPRAAPAVASSNASRGGHAAHCFISSRLELCLRDGELHLACAHVLSHEHKRVAHLRQVERPAGGECCASASPHSS
jgi:hypothetical protein